jgi:2,4-diaminopentanoate dehydrogenase
MDLILYGLGPIGTQILDLALRSESLQVRGAVDIDPEKVGRDVGTLRGGTTVGVEVVDSVAALPAEVAAGGGTALHAAGSHLETVWPQIRELLDAGFSVVSTCEELAYPWHRHPEVSRDIDQQARRQGLTVLGVGVNPGFVMDVLPLCVTAVLGDVRTVRVRRAVDVSGRRLPLQRKVGVGLAPAEFARLAASGAVGHVGLEESARLVAHGLRWDLVEVATAIAPTTASKVHRVALGDLAPGDVDGLEQSCVATTGDGRRVELALTMRVETDQCDEVVLTGDPHLSLVIPGGVPGDTATAAIAVNCARRTSDAGPGLRLMTEVGLPRHG